MPLLSKDEYMQCMISGKFPEDSIIENIHITAEDLEYVRAEQQRINTEWKRHYCRTCDNIEAVIRPDDGGACYECHLNPPIEDMEGEISQYPPVLPDVHWCAKHPHFQKRKI